MCLSALLMQRSNLTKKRKSKTQNTMNKLFFAIGILFFFQQPVFAQEIARLEATEDQALLQVTVTDMESNIRIADIIVFEGENSKKVFQGISNEKGEFEILLPEGDIYMIKIKGLGEEQNYSRVEIGNDEGIYEGAITIRYEPAKTFTLENVHFDFNKATLRSESYASLDDLAKILRIKPGLKIEIAGHTDDVGDDASNLKLSQARAESVVKYLIGKNIDAKRLVAKGYGESEPVAGNDTDDGRQKNRRTEVRILEDL